jgi:hypothetical protein
VKGVCEHVLHLPVCALATSFGGENLFTLFGRPSCCCYCDDSSNNTSDNNNSKNNTNNNNKRDYLKTPFVVTNALPYTNVIAKLDTRTKRVISVVPVCGGHVYEGGGGGGGADNGGGSGGGGGDGNGNGVNNYSLIVQNSRVMVIVTANGYTVYDNTSNGNTGNNGNNGNTGNNGNNGNTGNNGNHDRKISLGYDKVLYKRVGVCRNGTNGTNGTSNVINGVCIVNDDDDGNRFNVVVQDCGGNLWADFYTFCCDDGIAGAGAGAGADADADDGNYSKCWGIINLNSSNNTHTNNNTILNNINVHHIIKYCIQRIDVKLLRCMIRLYSDGSGGDCGDWWKDLKRKELGRVFFEFLRDGIAGFGVSNLDVLYYEHFGNTCENYPFVGYVKDDLDESVYSSGNLDYCFVGRKTHYGTAGNGMERRYFLRKDDGGGGGGGSDDDDDNDDDDNDDDDDSDSHSHSHSHIHSDSLSDKNIKYRIKLIHDNVPFQSARFNIDGSHEKEYNCNNDDFCFVNYRCYDGYGDGGNVELEEEEGLYYVDVTKNVINSLKKGW